MESTRVKKALRKHLDYMMINGSDKDKIYTLLDLTRWLISALANDLAKMEVSYGGSKEHDKLIRELQDAENLAKNLERELQESSEIATASMIGFAAYHVARDTKDKEIEKAEEVVRNMKQKALMLALKKQYEEAFLAQTEATEAEHTVSAKKERNEWCYLWDLITCQLR